MERQLIWIGCVVGMLVGLIVVHRGNPVYQAECEIELQPAGSSNLTLVYSGSLIAPTLNPETQAQILQSDAVLTRVALALDLPNDRNFSAFARPGQIFRMSQPAVREAVLSELRAGLTVRVQPDALERARPHSVRRPVDSSSLPILFVLFRDRSPALAAGIVRSVIHFYEARTFELRFQTMQRTADLLSRRMNDIKQKTEDEQRALLDLEHASGGFAVSGDTFARRGATDSGLQALALGAASATTRARTAHAASQLFAGSGGPQETVSLPSRAEPGLQALERVLSERQADLAMEQTTLGPDNPAVRQTEAAIATLRQQLALERARVRTQIANEAWLSEDQSAKVSDALRQAAAVVQQQQQAAVGQAALEVQLSKDSELYWVLTNNVRTAMIDAGYGGVVVNVLKPTSVPVAPLVRPYRETVAMDSFLGLCSGFLLRLLVYLRHQARPRAVAAIENLLGFACLATVPWRAGPLVPLPLSGLSERPTPFAEAIFALKANLLSVRHARPPRRILMTSATRRQGTSSIAASLAAALANSGLKVLLIDMPSASPGLNQRSRTYSTPGSAGVAGFSEVLGDAARLQRALQPVPQVPGLEVLAFDVEASSEDWLRSKDWDALLELLEAVYDFMVFDAMPVLPHSQLAGLLAIMDTVLVVIKRGQGKPFQLRQLRALLDNSGVRSVGFVLNGQSS